MLLAQIADGQILKTDVFTPGQEPGTLGQFENPTLLLEQGWEPTGVHSIPGEGAPVGVFFLLFKRRIPLGDIPELDEPHPTSKAWFSHKLKKDHSK